MHFAFKKISFLDRTKKKKVKESKIRFGLYISYVRMCKCAKDILIGGLFHKEKIWLILTVSVISAHFIVFLSGYSTLNTVVLYYQQIKLYWKYSTICNGI